jgi:hypothetical protein
MKKLLRILMIKLLVLQKLPTIRYFYRYIHVLPFSSVVLFSSLYCNVAGNCYKWIELVELQFNLILLTAPPQVLSEEVGCESDEIIGMELNVCDTQPSCLGGGSNEFIYSGRLDNLASCYCALRSLMDSSKVPEQLSNEKAVRMVAMFDNEEVSYIHIKCCLQVIFILHILISMLQSCPMSGAKAF